MNVRPCATAEEMRAAFAPLWHYFGQNPPSDDAVTHFKRVLPIERVHAGFDREKIVSGSASFAFDLTIPGGQVKAAGVTGDGDAGRFDLPAGDREIECKRGGAGDDLLAVESRMHALYGKHALEVRDGVIGRRVLAKIVPQRREGRAHLFRRGARPYVHDTSAVGKVPVELARLAIERPRLQRALVDADDRHQLGIVAGGEDFVGVLKVGVSKRALHYCQSGVAQKVDGTVPRDAA